MNHKTNTPIKDFLKECMNSNNVRDTSYEHNCNTCCEGSLKSENAEWLTTEQAAKYLCLPVGTVRNLTSNGKIPYYKLGRLNRYLCEDLRKLLLKQKRGANYGN